MAGTDERKVKSLRELSPAIEPPRDLWPQIEARLKAEQAAAVPAVVPPARRTVLPVRWLAAAAMVASVAVGVWIGRDVLPIPGLRSAATPLSAANRGTAGTGAGAVNAAYVSDPRYQRDRAQLVQSLQVRLDAMPPAARVKVTASLATIEKAKEDLEQALGKSVWALAYPFGGPESVTKRELEMAERAGYQCAFLNFGGGFGAETPRFAWPRVHVTSEMSLAEFETHVSGFYRWIRKRLLREEVGIAS